ncbi:CTP-dependent diacylglycerol kinase 1 [Gossypium australe]|uniref:CTP-dependent diacylglycerol kinase 1 n=1 Tax=Gossypium australe TaxID=47621 RepID=A0A5B6V799_9ROSI|nr:CTP-dependent diacylglycerol kinase 1 [Gossypium australe]
MEGQPKVKASLRLGSEFYIVNAKKVDALSEQLSSMKEESMSILKDYITMHNVPNDGPDELVEGSSEDDEEEPKKSNIKPKKAKTTNIKITQKRIKERTPSAYQELSG